MGTFERVMFKVEKHSSQDSKPVSQNSKPGSQNSKPGSQNSKPGSQHSKPGSQHSKPGSQDSKPVSQNSKPGSQNSKPWSPVYLGPSEDHFQRLEGDDGQSFAVDNQQDKKVATAASGSRAGGGTKPGGAGRPWVKIKMKNLRGVRDMLLLRWLGDEDMESGMSIVEGRSTVLVVMLLLLSLPLLLVCKYKSPGVKQLQRRHSSYAT
ncbi:hypothetical protein Ancab_023688 [Ancistrocladus abbreviatus]